jgi:cytochrome c oxidase subunit 2
MDMTTQNNSQDGGGFRGGLIPIVLFGVGIILVSVLLTFPLNLPGLILPEQASAEAQRTDFLFRVLFLLGMITFLLVQGLLMYAAVRYRAEPGDTSDGAPIHGNVTLEIVWTAIPAVIVFVLGVVSFLVWQDNTAPSSTGNVNMINNEPTTIEATGQRYRWGFTYLTNETDINDEPIAINSSDLHVYIPDPATCDDCKFELQMNTEDVIHSFWVPAMRVKQDLLPGRTTEVLFTPVDSGEGYEYISVVGPTAVYASQSTSGDVITEIEGAPEGEVAVPVEFELVENSTADELPEGFVAVDFRGQTGYIPSEAVTGRHNKYRLICTELCGGGHGEMYTWMVVHEDEEAFQASWYQPQVDVLFEPPDDPVELGRLILASGKYPCAGCHQLDSLDDWNGLTGPSLTGIGERAASRADAAGSSNAIDYLAESIRRPNDYLVSGYAANIMTYFGNTDTAPEGVANFASMPQDDLNAIVAYLCVQTSGSADATACDFNGDAEGNNITAEGAIDDLSAANTRLDNVTDAYQE